MIYVLREHTYSYATAIDAHPKSQPMNHTRNYSLKYLRNVCMPPFHIAEPSAEETPRSCERRCEGIVIVEANKEPKNANPICYALARSIPYM